VDSQNRSNNQGGGDIGSGGGGQRRRRHRGGANRGQAQNQGNRPEGAQPRSETSARNVNNPRPAGNPAPRVQSAENRNRSHQSSSRQRSRSGRVLTTNQVLVKYDNLLEQHLITRRKYYEYFNRVDERQLYKLEKNFFDSIEHLRRFESNLEPWQREALEKRKTERYKLDLTYSNNRGWNPEEIAKESFEPDENEDPHFKDSQREAFEEYKEDTEESVGTYEDYLKLKGQS
jgi:hypothetical protein